MLRVGSTERSPFPDRNEGCAVCPDFSPSADWHEPCVLVEKGSWKKGEGMQTVNRRGRVCSWRGLLVVGVLALALTGGCGSDNSTGSDAGRPGSSDSGPDTGRPSSSDSGPDTGRPDSSD